MFKKKSDKDLEADFAQAARQAARTPGFENRRAAQKAFDKLPKASKQKLKNISFEGLN